MGTEVLPILVVYSPGPRKVLEVRLTVEEGCTVEVCLQRSGFLNALESIHAADVSAGIWGRKTPLSQVVRANDRIELYRNLTVDPKVARRERFVRQGAKSAGLFAKLRDGAKAGY
jgi:putative ubiquitin-RnfH superfamily antitoxin RatB of RatAB toxin-antitoxin module